MEDAGRSSNDRVPRIVADRSERNGRSGLASPTVMLGVDPDRVERAPSGVERGDGIGIAGNPPRKRRCSGRRPSGAQLGAMNAFLEENSRDENEEVPIGRRAPRQ